MLRNLRIPSLWKSGKNLRCFSSADENKQELVNVEINDKTGVACMAMNNPPVNCLSLNFLKDFCDKIDLLEKEKVKGMILTSSVKKVFGAGLDFHELLKPEESRINAFWLWFQESWLKLYGCSFPTAALINGHALAGGCVYALSCEYRVMMKDLKIGLTETAVGIVPPDFVISCTRNALPTRKAELALVLGSVYTTHEALEMGFIDELAADEEEAVAQCESFLKKSAKIPRIARELTKQTLRKEGLDLLRNPQSRSADAKRFIDHINRPSTQEIIENHFANLKNSKK